MRRCAAHPIGRRAIASECPRSFPSSTSARSASASTPRGALGSDITKKVLEDYRTAPIEEKLRATLAFLEKVTLDHERHSADDVRPMLAAGVSREAIVDQSYQGAFLSCLVCSNRSSAMVEWCGVGCDMHLNDLKQICEKGLNYE